MKCNKQKKKIYPEAAVTLSGGLECFLLGLGRAGGSVWGSCPLPVVLGGLLFAPSGTGQCGQGAVGPELLQEASKNRQP